MTTSSWSMLALLMVAALLLSSCASVEQAAPSLEALSARMRAAPAGQLAQGRQIYVTRCAKCHRVEPVRRYPASEWEQDILPEMSKKAKLSGGEMASVRSYVMSVLRSPAA